MHKFVPYIPHTYYGCQCTHAKPVSWHESDIPKMEAIWPSETLVFCHTTTQCQSERPRHG